MQRKWFDAEYIVDFDVLLIRNSYTREGAQL